MISNAQNRRLTEVGPGTPMGELMRRYWQPFLPASQLDEDPVQPVKLLGEELVCYRDRSGRVGLIGRRCAHRLVDLRFGIPEEEGLRCPYHGWCYDAEGHCTETPLESPNSRLKDQIAIGGYPVQEMGGLLFAYLGPLPAPVLPPWDILVYPRALRQIGVTVIPCNWLQCQENTGDPVHSVYLHGHFFKYQLEKMGVFEERAFDPATHRSGASISNAEGFSHVISKVDQYGVQKAMVFTPERGAPEYKEHWHSYNLFPHMVRVGSGGIRYELQIRVPMDDEHTYHIAYDIYGVPEGMEVEIPERVPSYEIPAYDEEGRPVLDFVLAQDAVAWESQGAVVDRSAEHLGATDEAIVRFRELLEEQLQIVEAGGDPMNTFRDPSAVGEMIRLRPAIAPEVAGDDPWIGANRQQFHKGYWRDEGDRYGPLLPKVLDLMRRSAEERG
jgi:5,5'-dehydrodivanillate O-demethylase oxygenase subunit